MKKKIILFFYLLLLSHQTYPETFEFKSAPKWYPEKKQELLAQLEKDKNTAENNYNFSADGTKICAMIMPHASLGASGDVASATCRLLDKSHFTKVIVIGLSHRSYGAQTPFVFLPSKFTKYKTPLGPIELEQDVTDKLIGIDHKLFSYHAKSFEQEHSLEVELPVLQFYLKDFTLLPILVNNPNTEQFKQAAKLLKTYIDKNTLIVASSDFTHHGKAFGYNIFPEQKTQQQSIKVFDSMAISTIENLSLEQFSSFLAKTQATICGKNPIKFLLSILNTGACEKVYPHVIAYNTSGKKFNSTDHSVSYAGIIFTNESPNTKPLENQFTQLEKEDLLLLAQKTIGNIYADPKLDETQLLPHRTKAEHEPMGVFVTLTQKNPPGRLRGCIGRIISHDPLYKTIMSVAKSAALNDHRFKPVTKDELTNIIVALSILGKPKQAKLEEITLGRHGIILKLNGHSAVFLPEVATDQGWSLQTTLEHLSQKAGLEKNAYKNSNTIFEIFETIKIKEK
ncbi:AmmeMemoRadiSam system protein B [bacterium]|jgi:MEMO1 family protein|nr:AmmeMemoRadiSam system protein B [bacterium]